MILRIAKWLPSTIYFLLAGTILYSNVRSYSLILLALALLLYLAATVLRIANAIALSWLLLATIGVFSLAYGKYELIDTASIVSVCVFASLIELTNRSLISGSKLTSNQLLEVRKISKHVMLASLTTMMIALTASIGAIYIAGNAIILSNPVAGVLLFGSLMIALILIALSEAIMKRARNDSS